MRQTGAAHGYDVDNGVDSGLAPVKVGAVADDILTAVSDGDVAQLVTDLYRRLKVKPESGWVPIDGGGQVVSIGAAAARSTALTVGEEYHISATVNCWIVAGGVAVDAVAGADYKLLANVVFPYHVLTGLDYISVIRDSVDAASGLAICKVS